MLVDSNELPGNSQIDCDICIAGSGPVGITIAAELAGGPLRVCLVESGGLSARAAVPAPSVAEQLGIPVDLVQFQQHAFGGASNQWGGTLGRWFRLKRMDPIDFEIRPWVPNSGWPFEYAELELFFERAIGMLNDYNGDFSADAYQAHLAPAFHNNELRTTIFHMVRPPRFGQNYRTLVTMSNNIQAYLHGRVIEIEEDPNSPIVRYFHIATPSGRRHRILAKHFVLACGGLENPRLLLASKGKSTSGVGNQRDLVGRYYMQHPRGLAGIAVLNRKSLRSPLYTRGLRVNEIRIGGAISFSEEFQRRERALNHCIMFRPIFALSESYVSQAYQAVCRGWRGVGDSSDWRGALLDLSKSSACGLKRGFKSPGLFKVSAILNHMEQIPKPESRVELSEQKDQSGVHQLRTDWRIDSIEKASLCRLHRLVQQRLVAQSAGWLESRLDLLADWPVSQDSAHHMGTTRMHADPRRGVVDSNCRVHDMQNLYIGGSSVLPTGGHANPTLTIVALAVRLADHLKSLCRAHRMDAGSHRPFTDATDRPTPALCARASAIRPVAGA